MSTQVFTEVLFRRYGSTEKDTGTLTITQDFIQFAGRTHKLILTNIQFISYGKPGRFMFGDWIQVIYGGSLQPSVAYLRSAKNFGGIANLFSALHHFPNTHQIECTVWTYRNMSGLAQRKLGEFNTPRKAYLGATKTGILMLSISRKIMRAITLTEVIGFTHERLTGRQQVTSQLLNMFIVSATVGLIMAFIFALLLQGFTSLSLAHRAFYLALIGIAIFSLVFITLLLDSIPYIFRSRTVSLFTLKFRDARPLEFGVPEQQAEQVAKTLKSWGITKLTA